MTKTTQKELPVVIYDCFSSQRYGGNVGGIVLDAGALETNQMQKIAREINAPVTGFVTDHTGNEVSVRFFMPGAEIAMCGHVTVGLFSYFSNGSTLSEFVMKVKAGDIAVKVNSNNSELPNVMMQLSVPAPVKADIDLPALADALGVATSALETQAPIGVSDAGLKHLFVHLSSLDEVQKLTPDFQKLKDLSIDSDVQTIACFAMEATDPLNTLHIRDFCPALGVDEVPASGTTNGALAGYLLQHGLISNTSQRILAEQGTEIGRPSIVCSEISVDAGAITKLSVGGQAVVSLKGAILV